MNTPSVCVNCSIKMINIHICTNKTFYAFITKFTAGYVSNCDNALLQFFSLKCVCLSIFIFDQLFAISSPITITNLLVKSGRPYGKVFSYNYYILKLTCIHIFDVLLILHLGQFNWRAYWLLWIFSPTNGSGAWHLCCDKKTRGRKYKCFQCGSLIQVRYIIHTY